MGQCGKGRKQCSSALCSPLFCDPGARETRAGDVQLTCPLLAHDSPFLTSATAVPCQKCLPRTVLLPLGGKKPPWEGPPGVSFSRWHIEQSPEVCTHLQPDMGKRFTKRCSLLGRLNVKNEEIDEMIKEAPGPINFTVFLTMFGEKLKGERSPGEIGGAGVCGHPHHHQYPVPPGEATQLLGSPSPFQVSGYRVTLTQQPHPAAPCSTDATQGMQPPRRPPGGYAAPRACAWSSINIPKRLDRRRMPWWWRHHLLCRHTTTLHLLLYMLPPVLEVPAAGLAFPWAPRFPVHPPSSPQRLGEAGGCSWLPPSMAVAVSSAGADPEETILNAFKVFDPEGKGLKSA